MNETTTVFLISGTPNPRLNKRIELAKSYSVVHLVYWNRAGKEKKYVDNRCILHEFCKKTKDSIIHRLPYYKSFSTFAKQELMKIMPEIIHVQGLDMLRIACEFSLNHSVKIIYEVPDIPHLIIDKPSNFLYAVVQDYLDKLEKKCLNKVDLLIVTSPQFIDHRYGRLVEKEKIMYFANVPESSYLEKFKRKDRSTQFTIGFIGAVRYKEQMMNLLECAKKTCAKYLIAGYEIEGNEIELAAKQINNVVWYGEYSFAKDGAKLYGECDAIYAVYDADMINVQAALPNKLYESVYCELPIIVAKGTYLEKIVNEWGVGIAVDCHNQEELMDAITKLINDRDYYESIVNNCKEHKRDTEIDTYNNQLVSLIQYMLMN